MYKEKILVVFDCDGVIVRRDYTQKCFEKFNNSKILRKMANVVMKAYSEGKIPPLLEPLPYIFLVHCLKETRIDEIEDYISRTAQFYLTPNISNVIKELKEKGIKVGIVSENVQFLPKYTSRILDVDFVCSNEVEIKNGKLTGKFYRFSKKNEMIDRIVKQFSISRDKIIYIGDELSPLNKVKCMLFDPKRKNDRKKIDNKNCFFIEDLSQVLPLIEKLYRI